MTKENKFYITTAIDYASGKPHIGHAYEKIAADVLARWNRNIGKEVFFQTGTDEHGQKIVEKAKEIGKTPKDFVDIIVPQFKNMNKKLNVNYDYFLRTTDEDHKKFVQKMLQKSFDNGDIYLGEYEGLYCVGCERYYTEDELIDGKICPDHKKEVEKVKEENYFFKLSKYEDKILELYENTDFLAPKSHAQETINRVKEGLQDVSISRNKDKLDWGIELPFDKSHVTYVWFDALFNYVSGLDINEKQDFWPAVVHIVGKDIQWFHNVYWPAFLMSVEMELPKKVFSHGHVVAEDGHKMSKSLGNVIDPVKFAKKFGVDELRYCLLTVGSFGEDIGFGEKIAVEKINNELNNDLGNLVSRVHAMTTKYFDGNIPEVAELRDVDYEFVEKLNIFEEFNESMQNLEFNKAFEILWTAIRETNAYVNLTAPYKEEDEKRLATVMNVLCSSVVLFAKYVNCIMPEKSKRILKQYNVVNDGILELEFFKSEHKLGEKDNLFEKIKLEEKEEQVVKPNVFIIHGVEGNENENWFPWMKTQLEKRGIEVIIPNFPTPENQNLENWMKMFVPYLSKVNESSIFIGHSLGVSFILNLLQEKNIKINHLYSIAGFASELEVEEKYEWINDINKSFYSKEFDWNKIKGLVNKSFIFQSSDDKFVSIDKAEELQKNLDGQLIMVDNAGHFNTAAGFVKFKQLLNMIKNNIKQNKPNNQESSEEKNDFEKLNLKAAQIVKVEKHPESDKLFVLQVNLGNETRQIVSGLQGIYTKEELENKNVIVISNLKPAKLGGYESNGMILACEDPEIGHDDCGLLTHDLEVGAQISCGDFVANNESKIKSKVFQKAEMKGQDNKVWFKEKELKGVQIDRGFKGKIC